MSLSERNMYISKESSGADIKPREHNTLILSLSTASTDSKQTRTSEVAIVPSEYCTPIDALREAFPERNLKKMKGIKSSAKGAGEHSRPRVGLRGEAKKVVMRTKSLNTVVDQVMYDEPITALSYQSLKNKDTLYENVVITPSEATPIPVSSGDVPRRETMPCGPHSEAMNIPRGRRIASVNEGPSPRPSQVRTKQNNLSKLYQNLKEIS